MEQFDFDERCFKDWQAGLTVYCSAQSAVSLVFSLEPQQQLCGVIDLLT